jgi:uncharacterized membrane protein
MWQTIKSLFKSYFVAGLLVLVPLVVSVWVLRAVISSTDEMLDTSSWLGFNIPGLGLVTSIVIILVAGFIGRNVVGKYLFSSTGEILSRLPLVGTIYSSTRQMMETLVGGSHKKFGRVVLIDYPSSSSKTIAFVTSEEVPKEVSSKLKENHLTVFVPTTPNPISGFYLYVPSSQAVTVDLTVDEAFKGANDMVLEGGMKYRSLSARKIIFKKSIPITQEFFHEVPEGETVSWTPEFNQSMVDAGEVQIPNALVVVLSHKGGARKPDLFLDEWFHTSSVAKAMSMMKHSNLPLFIGTKIASREQKVT